MDTMNSNKKCTCCKKTLPLSAFGVDRRKSGKVSIKGRCKQCCSQLESQRQQVNPQRQWLYRFQNADRNRSYQRRYYQQHKAQIRQRRNLRRKQSPAIIAQQEQASKERNSEYYAAIKILKALEKRTQKRGYAVEYTLSDWNETLQYFDNQCAICKRPAGTVYQIVPALWIGLSDQDCPGMIPNNIIPLCRARWGQTQNNPGCANLIGAQNVIILLEKRYGKIRASEIGRGIQIFLSRMFKRSQTLKRDRDKNKRLHTKILQSFIELKSI